MSSSVPPRRPVGASSIGADKKRRPWWLLALLALAALVVLALLLSRCGGDDKKTNPVTPLPAATLPASPAPVQPSVATVPSEAPSVAAAPSEAEASEAAAPSESAAPVATSAAPAASSDGSGMLRVGTTDLLAGPAAATKGLSAFTGKSVTGTGVLVQSVPADEGFWVGPDTTDRVWVQLKGTGESGYRVKRGDRVDLHGTLVANPAGFPRTVGVDASEGAAQLTTPAQHIAVAKGAVTLHK